MAKYTIELKTLIDSGYNIGLADYPIFAESYRSTLNDLIKGHFAFNEIGYEMPGMFKQRLNQTMDEIMPYYNNLYLAQIDLLPYSAVDLTETIEGLSNNSGTSSGTSASEQSNTGNNKNVRSDTPNGLLSIGNIDGDVYASEATIEKDDKTGVNFNTVANQTAGVSSGNSTRKLTGNDGRKNKSEIYSDYRKALVNIDKMILAELNILFMGVM